MRLFSFPLCHLTTIENMSGKKKHRTKAATAALQVCVDSGIEHSTISFETRTEDFGEEAAHHLKEHGIKAEQIFKTLLIDLSHGKGSKPELAVAIVPVTGRLSLKHAAGALSSRSQSGSGKATMADPHDAQKSTGYIPGGISPLGQKNSLPTVLDLSALNWETIYVSGGKRGLDIGLAPKDLIALTDAETADIVEGH